MPLSRKQMEALSPWLVTLGLFILWELIARVGKIPSYILPTPSESIIEGWQYKGPIMQHAFQTLYTTSAGFALAVVFGMLLGVLVGSSKVVYKALYPVLVGFNSVPKVALVPILVIWFGIGSVPAIITAFLISFFPVVVNVATGLATTEPELEDVMKALRATKLDILFNVGLPRAMPYFFASLKVSVTLAFVGTVIAETVASNRGIGNLMMIASSSFDVPLVFAGLLVLALLGVGLYAIFSLIEGRVIGWARRKDGAEFT